MSETTACERCGARAAFASQIAPLGDTKGARIYGCPDCHHFTWIEWHGSQGQQQQQPRGCFGGTARSELCLRFGKGISRRVADDHLHLLFPQSYEEWHRCSEQGLHPWIGDIEIQVSGMGAPRRLRPDHVALSRLPLPAKNAAFVTGRRLRLAI